MRCFPIKTEASAVTRRGSYTRPGLLSQRNGRNVSVSEVEISRSQPAVFGGGSWMDSGSHKPATRGQDRVITRQHETNRRIRYYRVLRKRSTDGRSQDGRMDRQLARGPGVPKNEELLGGFGDGEEKGRASKRAWLRAITGPRQPRHYPQLSACVLRLGFRGPPGRRRARVTARHRDPNVHVNPKEIGDKGGRERDFRGVSKEILESVRGPIHYVASGVRNRSILARFSFLGLYAFSRNRTTTRHATNSPWRVDA